VAQEVAAASIDPVAFAPVRARTPWQLTLSRVRRDRVAIAALVVLVLIACAAILAPAIAHALGHGPNTQYGEGLTGEGLPRGPSAQFLVGTDDLGRDVLVRVLYGARISLLVGVVASGAAVALGVVIGIVAGYFGGAVDSVLARLIDLNLSLPFLLSAIAIVSLVGPSLPVALGLIAFFSWAPLGRVVRTLTVSLRGREFVEAARSIGAGDLRIMAFEIFPNLVGPVLVYLTLLVPTAIVFEATLSFLGLGVSPPTPTWGNMLAESLGYYQVAWWFVLAPGSALLVTTLCFNLLGDSIRDALDPRAGALFRLRRV
jgi:peptide/nickel transport system permease protein